MLPGYGFDATEGGEPIKTSAPPQPTSGGASIQSGLPNPYLGVASAAEDATAIYRARCIGCHKAGGGSGPDLFRTGLSAKEFRDAVQEGGNGMPAFRELLDEDEILKLHALVASHDRL